MNDDKKMNDDTNMNSITTKNDNKSRWMIQRKWEEECALPSAAG
jgi:hypothetical protein